jgi:hypothetical protein
MNNVIFDESPVSISQSRTTTGGMTGFLVRHKIAQTVGQAQAILIVFSIIMFVATFILIRMNVTTSVVQTDKGLAPAGPSY